MKAYGFVARADSDSTDHRKGSVFGHGKKNSMRNAESKRRVRRNVKTGERQAGKREARDRRQD